MNLQSKLSELREKETDLTKRAAALGDKAGSDDGLNAEERSELQEIETNLGDLRQKQTDIERSLKVGNFSANADDDLGLSEKELRNFSLVKLFRAANPKASAEQKRAGAFELEACAAQADLVDTPPRGYMIPLEVLRGTKPQRKEMRAAHLARMERRDLTTTSFNSAGALVGIDQPLPMIELLRNMMLSPSLGVMMLDGLVGDIQINKQTAAGTAYWVDGDGIGELTESGQTVGQVTMTPKYLGMVNEYSLKLLQQASISVENFVRTDQTRTIAIEKDRALFHGTGGAGQPIGITNTLGINTKDFASASNPTRSELIDMRSAIASDNALVDTVSFVTNSTVYGNMMKQAIDSGSGLFLLDAASGRAIGKQVNESNQIATDHIVLGDWSQAIIGEWGTLDYIVDVYTKATQLLTRVIGVTSCDSAVRHAEAFCDGSSTY